MPKIMTQFIDDFSREVWFTTYKHHSDNSINDTLARVAKAVASAEKNDLKEEWEEKFLELLSNFKIVPGGRILANAGTDWKGTTWMNCFVGPKPKYDQDSLEGIFSVLLSQAMTLKSEGGWGMNFSFIRPRGSFIYGIGVETPGAVKYAELFNTSSDIITAGSGKKKTNKEGKIKIRKGAMMGILDCWHPDIEEWITAKLQDGRLNKFNLSVNCSNEFMDRIVEIKFIENELKKIDKQNFTSQEASLAVGLQSKIEELNKWDLVFPDTQHPKYKEEWDGNISLWKSKGYPVKVYKTINILDLWNLIMASTYERNDPGVLFLDRANESHCWNYGGPEAHIASTNPCGEQCLPFGAVCNLASINLTQFVKDDQSFDFEALSKYVPWAVRFLDNVNSLTGAPLPEYKESIEKRRRIGLGVMGWGSMLYMMNIRFGTNEAEVLKDKIMKTFTNMAVKASVQLANEKGMFDGCSPSKHSRHKFFKDIGIPLSVLEDMGVHGIRNSALFSCQPTGNTGVLANVVSGGIEPLFLSEYIRTVIVDECPTDVLPLCPKYWEGEFKETPMFKWVKEGEDNILKGEHKGTIYKIDRNRGLTKEVECIDYGVRWLISKKLWNPKANWAVTASSLTVEEHITDLKGFAKWVDSSISKTVNIANDYPFEKFKDIYLNAYLSETLKGITTYRAGTMMNVLAEKKKVNLPITTAPKRPNKLPGELHHFVLNGKKYYVAVGLFGEDRQPYEVFTGINQEKDKSIFIPKECKTGEIVKKTRGKYLFISEEEEYELTNGHSDDVADGLTRMISIGLRHGSDISFVVHQLEKTKGPIVCFSKVLARTLKKYIKDGTKVSGENCPTCEHELERKEGCLTCSHCGYSKCN